jgi:hypothetical protein
MVSKMARPKDVSVSLYDTGKGELHVWGISLRIKGSIPRLANGKANEAAIKRKEKQIAKLIELLEISED